MHTTEYITGKARSFFEPETTALANKRIATGRGLLKELSKNRHINPEEKQKRYQAAEESIAWWTKLLEEE